MSNVLVIREPATDDEIASVFALMSVLRPQLKQELFVQQVRRMMSDGYRLAIGRSARVVVAAGYRLSETLARGRHLFVDDLVTDPALQRNGYATQMLRYLAQVARREGIARIHLDTRDSARTYYEKVGFTMFTSIPCAIEVEQLLG